MSLRPASFLSKSILILSFLIAFPSASLAIQEPAPSQPSLAEAYLKQLSLSDYRSLSKIEGGFSSESEYSKGDLSFKISASSKTHKESMVKGDQFSQLSFEISFKEEYGGWEEANSIKKSEKTIKGNLELITKENDLYVYLRDAQISVSGDDHSEEELDFIKNQLNWLKGQWYHLSADELASWETAEWEEGLEYFDPDFQEQLETALKKASEGQGDWRQSLKEGVLFFLSMEALGLSEKDREEAAKVMDAILEAKLFSQRTVLIGEERGAIFFSLNKWGVVELFKDISLVLGKGVSEDDLTELSKVILPNLSLSGRYSADAKTGALNRFFLHFGLKDPLGLGRFWLKVDSRTFAQGIQNTIHAPRNHTSLQEALSQFEE